MKSICIGIDFGTTNTLVSYIEDKSKFPVLSRLGRSSDSMPTTIHIDSGGSPCFGDDANDYCEYDSSGYVRGFKLWLGGTRTLKRENSEKEYSAVELTMEFLKHIREKCEQESLQGHYHLDRAVITIPVSFSPARKADLKKAAQKAGFQEVILVPEPEAAGKAFCTLCPEEAFKGSALIVDWGGGTLDLSLVQRTEEGFKVQKAYSRGDETMGGEVLDTIMWNHVANRLKLKFGIDLGKEPVAKRYALRKRIRQAKEKLSLLNDYTLLLPLQEGLQRISIFRQEWEEVIGSQLGKVVQMVEDILARLAADHQPPPNIILLVGGSSKTPRLRELLEQRTSIPCKFWDKGMEAVGLGAALFDIQQRESSQIPGNDLSGMGDDSSSSKRQPHKLNVEAWEMLSGCVKTVDIQGNQFDVRIPSGVAAGTRLRLPASKTKGLGDIELELVLQDPGDAKEKPLYIEGLEYLHGINGHRIDYREAANYFTRGYEQGDLNAAYMLCECYREGFGVPRDPSFAFKLAEFLIERGYFPAYYHLSEAWRTGKGVPMDQQKVKDFSDKLKRTCSQPVAGIDEILRYDSLMKNELSKEKPDTRELERLARLNFKISNLPTRFGFLVAALLSKDVEESPSAREEIRKLLDEGCKQGDLFSVLFKGGLLCGEDHSIFAPDKDKGISLLRKAASYGEPAALFLYSEELDNESQSKQVLNRFWNVCRLGASCIPGDKELNCAIRLEPSPFACVWNVYERSIAMPLLAQERLEQLVTQFPPQLVLKNENSHTLHNIKIRICCGDKQLDRTIEIPSSLSSDDELKINPLDYDLELGEDLYVEVYSGARCSRMDLRNIIKISDFMRGSPPLAMWWEEGFFDGFILRLACRDGSISNVIVRKEGGASTSPIYLNTNQEPPSIGWVEFSDDASLSENEMFWIESAEYPPILGRILTTPDDSGSSDWETAAKIVGGGLLGILAAGS